MKIYSIVHGPCAKDVKMIFLDSVAFCKKLLTLLKPLTTLSLLPTKEAIALVLDVSPSMDNAPEGTDTPLQKSLMAINMIIQRKVLYVVSLVWYIYYCFGISTSVVDSYKFSPFC